MNQKTLAERFGLTERQFQILSDLVIDPLKRQGAKIWIFGSRATNTHRHASDVDMLFEFPTGRSAPSGFIYGIKTDLEESRFPFVVDLVELKDLADSYLPSVERDRIAV